jgi:hypothetical protein
MADAAAADEALLDLGDINPPGPSAEADDFILDLADDAPPIDARAGALSVETSFFDEPEFASIHASADAAGAFAEAAHGEDAPADTPQPFRTAPTGSGWAEPSSSEVSTQDEPQSQGVSHTDAAREEPQVESGMSLSQMRGAHEFIEPQVIPAEVPEPSETAVEFMDGSVEGDVAKSPSVVGPGPVPVDDAAIISEPQMEDSARGVSEAGSVSPEQLSPETIEAIARRVVELMSERVVREIAWEVVPDLAEHLIRKRLDEERR